MSEPKPITKYASNVTSPVWQCPACLTIYHITVPCCTCQKRSTVYTSTSIAGEAGG